MIYSVKKPAPIEIGFEGRILQYSTCKPAHTTVEAILDYYGDLCEEPLELWHGNTKVSSYTNSFTCLVSYLLVSLCSLLMKGIASNVSRTLS